MLPFHHFSFFLFLSLKYTNRHSSMYNNFKNNSIIFLPGKDVNYTSETIHKSQQLYFAKSFTNQSLQISSNKPTHQYNNLHIPRGHCKLATRFVFSKTLCFSFPCPTATVKNEPHCPLTLLARKQTRRKKRWK